jgi:DNA-binding protein HU-beta
MSMTKSQMVDNLAILTDMDKKEVAKVLDGLTAMAYEYVKVDGEFTLPGLGKIVKIFRKERKGRNPFTGAAITIKAKNVVKFRVQKALKDSVL